MIREDASRVADLLRAAGRGDVAARERLRRLLLLADALHLDRERNPAAPPPPRAKGQGP